MLGVLPFVEDPDLSVSAARATSATLIYFKQKICAPPTLCNRDLLSEKWKWQDFETSWTSKTTNTLLLHGKVKVTLKHQDHYCSQISNWECLILKVKTHQSGFGFNILFKWGHCHILTLTFGNKSFSQCLRINKHHLTSISATNHQSAPININQHTN